MVYSPQRRHAVAQMSTAIQTLALVQHLYFPSTPVLLLRVFCLVQIRAPVIIQPTRSLFSLFFLVTSTNMGAVFLHVMFYDYNAGSKGLILDFVGQATSASLLRILILDLALFILLTVTLIVGYVVNYSPTLPKTDLFPYDDLLLPPETPVSPMPEGDIDVESGDQFRQRRLGKGPRYHHVATNETEIWLEDEAEEDSSLLSRTRSQLAGAPIIRRRRSGVPLVFNLPLSHMFNLLFKLPGPSPLHVTSGGTPFTTPPASPRTTRDMAVNALAAMIQESANHAPPPQPPTVESPTETRRSPSSSSDTASSSESGERRGGQPIPGDYWTSRA